MPSCLSSLVGLPVDLDHRCVIPRPLAVLLTGAVLESNSVFANRFVALGVDDIDHKMLLTQAARHVTG